MTPYDMLDQRDPMEVPVDSRTIEREKLVVRHQHDEDFLAAVKRFVYGFESLKETVPEVWSEEVQEIQSDIEEIRRLWPKGKDGL